MTCAAKPNWSGLRARVRARVRVRGTRVRGRVKVRVTRVKVRVTRVRVRVKVSHRGECGEANQRRQRRSHAPCWHPHSPCLHPHAPRRARFRRAPPPLLRRLPSK